MRLKQTIHTICKAKRKLVIVKNTQKQHPKAQIKPKKCANSQKERIWPGLAHGLLYISAEALNETK